MKLRKSGEILLATAVSLCSALLITACGSAHTIDFVYASSSKNNPGQVYVYKVNGGSGLLRQLPQSPYPSGGRNPVYEVASPDGKSLYAINRDDNTVLQYAIGTDGKLYPLNTYNTPGGFPVAATVSHDGAYLYVVDTYQPGFTDPTPGPGAVVVFPIKASDGSLGSPVANGNLPYFPVGFAPAGISVLANGAALYVTSKGGGPLAQPGRVYSFSVGTGGFLTPLPQDNAANAYLTIGNTPAAITSTANSSFVYVTDSTANLVYGFAINATGALTPVPASPFVTGLVPLAVTIDPTAAFLFVANYNAGTINIFSIAASGSLTPGKTVATGAGPTCIIVDPKEGKYIFTSNFLDGTISGFQLDPNTGSLIGIENSPYSTGGQATCVASVVNRT